MKKLAILLLGVLLVLPAAAQKTVVYPAIPGMTTSPDYTLSANGQSVWVEQVGPEGMESLHVANFSCEGTQTIVIQTPNAIKDYSIQPASAGIKATVKKNTLTFKINGPEKLYIQVNGKPYLALFANPLETEVPAYDAPGVRYFGPGTHEVGRIALEDGMTVYIAGGALVNASFTGSGKNVRILGRGSLGGNLSVNGCENLTVEGIFMRSTRGWTNTVTNSVNTVYRNVKVFSHTGTWGLDGINPVSSKGFLIEDCFIRTRDDCIAVKANGNPDNFDLSCRDVTVRGCLLVGWDHADGMTLGFELNGGIVENIRMVDCDILRARGSGRTGGHAAFSIVCDGPSEVRNITFEDIRVESDIEYKNLEIILTEGERYGNGRMGSVKGVLLKNVRWANPVKPLAIIGHPTRFVEDVTFENCTIGGKPLTGLKDADFQLEFVKGLNFIPGGPVTIDRYPNEPQGGRVPGQRAAQGQQGAQGQGRPQQGQAQQGQRPQQAAQGQQGAQGQGRPQQGQRPQQFQGRQAQPAAPLAGTFKDDGAGESKILGKTVHYTVYLPKDFATSGKTYPILYLLHGAGGDHGSWQKDARFSQIADRMIAAGQIPEMVIVCPEGFMHAYVNAFDGSASYEDFFLQEFMPFIEKEYRIRGDKEHRAISGLSMGGYGSLYHSLRHPDLFGSCFAMSPATGNFTFRGKDENNLTAAEKAYVSAHSIPDILRGLTVAKDERGNVTGQPRLFMEIGDDDFLLLDNFEVIKALRETGIPHQFRVRDGAHTWDFWRETLPSALEFVSESFR